MATSARTANPSDAVGQAVSLPPQYQALNTASDPNAGMTQYLQDYYTATGYVPDGFSVQNGALVDDRGPGFIMADLFPAIGIAGGLIGVGATAYTLLAGATPGAVAPGSAATDTAGTGITATSGIADPTVIGSGVTPVAGSSDLASTTIGTGDVGPIASTTSGNLSGSTISSIAASTGASPSTISQVAKLLGATGSGLGNALTATGQNQLNQENAGLTANAQNITGASDYQNALINTAGANQKLENTVLNNAALQSKITNPSVSPYDVAPPTYSPAFEAAAKSAAAMPYTPIAAPTPYTPISPSGVQAATGTTPSTLQTVGQWLAPALTIASKL